MERNRELGGQVDGPGITHSLDRASPGIISLPLPFLNS